MEYPTGTSPTDVDAIAAATVQTSAVIIYNLNDSSWSQDVSSVGCIVVYNDRFSLVSVNVRVKLQWLQLEQSENQQPIPGPRMRYSYCRHWLSLVWLSGVPDFFDRNKILSGGDLSHYQVPHCIRVFFYFVWFVFIHHNFQCYFELCTYCNILDIYLS